MIVVATDSHRKSFLQRLREHGVDIAAAVEQGRYISLKVADTLATYMVNDLPDPARCVKVAGDPRWKPRKRRNGSLRGLQFVVNVRHFVGAREGGCGNSGRTPMGRNRSEARSGYFVRICVEQFSA